MALKEPMIFENDTEFEEKDLKEAMKREKASIDDFDVKDEVPVSELSQEELNEAHTLLWVRTWKGFVKSRLCVRGFTQIIKDLDDTYASTPVIYMLRLVLLLALIFGWSIMLFDISTAFYTPISTQRRPFSYGLHGSSILSEGSYGGSRRRCTGFERHLEIGKPTLPRKLEKWASLDVKATPTSTSTSSSWF